MADELLDTNVVALDELTVVVVVDNETDTLSSVDRAFNLLVCDLRETGVKAMPFDGVGFPIDDRVSKIDQVIDLLATPNQWCKAQFKTVTGATASEVR